MSTNVKLKELSLVDTDLLVNGRLVNSAHLPALVELATYLLEEAPVHLFLLKIADDCRDIDSRLIWLKCVSLLNIYELAIEEGTCSLDGIIPGAFGKSFALLAHESSWPGEFKDVMLVISCALEAKRLELFNKWTTASLKDINKTGKQFYQTDW